MYRIVMECQVCRTPASYDADLPDVGNRYEYCATCKKQRLFDICACVDISGDVPTYKDAYKAGCGPMGLR